jgi:hypothetical protein
MTHRIRSQPDRAVSGQARWDSIGHANYEFLIRFRKYFGPRRAPPNRTGWARGAAIPAHWFACLLLPIARPGCVLLPRTPFRVPLVMMKPPGEQAALIVAVTREAAGIPCGAAKKAAKYRT